MCLQGVADRRTERVHTRIEHERLLVQLEALDPAEIGGHQGRGRDAATDGDALREVDAGCSPRNRRNRRVLGLATRKKWRSHSLERDRRRIADDEPGFRQQTLMLTPGPMLRPCASTTQVKSRQHCRSAAQERVQGQSRPSRRPRISPTGSPRAPRASGPRAANLAAGHLAGPLAMLVCSGCTASATCRRSVSRSRVSTPDPRNCALLRMSASRRVQTVAPIAAASATRRTKDDHT